MNPSNLIRPCQVCGTFYPARKPDLLESIQKMINDVDSSCGSGTLVGLILPHAGYQYSGPTAAYGISLLMGKRWDTVIIVSPSHREFFDGISVFPGEAYQTPLGAVPIDKEMREALLGTTQLVVPSNKGHGEEHAVEVQLPLLQFSIGDFSLLPIVIGHQQPAYCFELGRVLAEICKTRQCLLIASTDLSHYYPAATAERIDQVVIDDVRDFNFQKLMDDLECGHAEACGGGPTVSVMTALHQMGADRVEILNHTHSGIVTGDMKNVVGYLSAAIYTS